MVVVVVKGIVRKDGKTTVSLDMLTVPMVNVPYIHSKSYLINTAIVKIIYFPGIPSEDKEIYNSVKYSMATGGDDKVFKRPDSLLCDTQKAVTLTNSDNQMRHFVTENLEEKLRILTPQSKMEENLIPSQNTPSSTKTTCLQMPHIPQIDANVLNDIEIEAQYLATSVDNLTENLCNLLHSISSITADNVEVHKNAVDKLTDSIDANIKCMYTIMAKAEEISKSMQPTERIGTRIREIKRLVDVLDGII